MEKTLENMTLGVASASFQIEGGWKDDGKGESIWDRWLHIPGHGAATGDVATDHYHRFEEDMKLLKEIGVDAYRLSISWARVLPEGHGRVNEAGLQFYRTIFTRLKEYGIKTAVTLFHWDLPQKLQDIGGWTNPLSVAYFKEYAELMFREFGELVDSWITFNEPFTSSYQGYVSGKFAPGHRDFSEMLQVSHNILRSHGEAVRSYRSGGYPGKIGISLCFYVPYAATDCEEDLAAEARERAFRLGWFAEPVFKGQYPQMLWERFREKGVVLPEIAPGDMELIHEPIDFLGINYYRSGRVKYCPGGEWPQDIAYLPCTSDKTDMNYSIEPEKLYTYLKYLKDTYAPKEIVITENGYSAPEAPDRNGQIMDYNRIDYLYRHIEQCILARKDNIPVTGYYVWCFLDDLEWTGGYGTRMGLVRVDYETQKRTLKESARWYQRVLKERRLVD